MLSSYMPSDGGGGHKCVECCVHKMGCVCSDSSLKLLSRVALASTKCRHGGWHPHLFSYKEQLRLLIAISVKTAGEECFCSINPLL